MRLPHLPASLALALIVLVATALPASAVDLKVLTPKDFDSTVAKGVWLVEHFSPYCGHCKKFAPTWEKLVEETEKDANIGIQLAQVNCAVHGDLCDKHKITGYPQINLYRNGEFVEQFKKGRDYDTVWAYITQHAEPSVSKAQPIDDAVAAAPAAPTTPALDYNSAGTVLVLDSASFEATRRQGPAFVKFYAPWCGHCKRLAPHWSQLAHAMQHKLTIAEVDCEEQPALCKREGVTGYPMLFYYSAAGTKTEYTGGRKFEQLKAFADKANSPPVESIKDSDFETKVKENEVLFLFLYHVGDSRRLNDLTLAAQALLGVAPVYTSSSSDLQNRLLPNTKLDSSVLLVFKDHKPTPYASLSDLPASNGVAHIQGWLEANKLPTALELTADTFQSVMNAPHGPLIVLVAVPKEAGGYAAQVREVAKQWTARDRPIVFAWMDQERWASWLKSMYGITETPAVVIVDHKCLVYWNTDEFKNPIQLSSVSIFSALDAVLRGAISPINSENIIERMARSLNNGLTSVESYISGNPITTIFFAFCVVGLLILGIRRVLADELPDDFPSERKSRRAD